MPFSDELQALLDRYPEVEEVKVKYKKAGTVFKPRLDGKTPISKEFASNLARKMDNMSALGGSDTAIAAEMIRKGEL